MNNYLCENELCIMKNEMSYVYSYDKISKIDNIDIKIILISI